MRDIEIEDVRRSKKVKTTYGQSAELCLRGKAIRRFTPAAQPKILSTFMVGKPKGQVEWETLK